MNDTEVIEELKRRIAGMGDIQAYRQLFELLAPKLQRFVFYFFRSREVSEEIVSDVFIRLWQQRSTLNAVQQLKSYVYMMARNMSLNELSKRAHDPLKHHMDIDPEDVLVSATPESILISDDMQARIKEAIAKLPPQCQLIFTMVREDGLKYQEVADILQVSRLTVRNQVAIAISKLAGALDGYFFVFPASKK